MAKENQIGECLLVNIDTKQETNIITRLDNGILCICIKETPNEPLMILDLFLYSVYPKPDENVFLLVKDRETIKLKPLNDTVNAWTYRIRQSNYEIQRKFLHHACDQFFDSVCILLF